MVEGFALKCAKYLLFVFNIIFVLAGAVLIIIGALAQSEANGPFHLAIFIIILGCIIFIVAFFGCCGAIRENRCMLIAFSVMLVVILILCVIGAIVAFVFRTKAEEQVRDLLINYVKNYDKGKHHSGKLLDELQEEHHCCGASNYTDWDQNEDYSKNHSVPDSCCKTVSTGCGYNGLTDPTNINTVGCLDAAKGLLETTYLAIGAVAGCIALIMIIGIILGSCLAKSMPSGYSGV